MNTNRLIKMLALLIAALMCTSALTACSLGNASKYRQALELTEQGDYEAAYALFTELGDYKDAAEEAAKFHYIPIKETAQLISPEGTRIENLVISLNENNLPYQCIKTGENGYQHTCLYSYTAGNQLMKITCSATDGTTENYECTYDQNGYLIKEHSVYGDGSTSTYEYAYDENGNQTKMVITESSGYFYSGEYTYDAEGREIKSVITDDYGTSTYENVYDAEGNLIKEIMTDESGTTIYENVYDAEGNRTKEIMSDENGNAFTIYEYSYDEQGNLLETTIKEGDSTWTMTKCTYDEKGQLISEYFDFGDGHFFAYEYAYDDNGNVSKKRVYGSSGYDDTYTTEYKLVYIPFEYTEEEWNRLVFELIGW